MSMTYVYVLGIVMVGCFSYSQAFEHLRYTHITVARPLSQRCNSYPRRQPKTTPRGEDSIRPPPLHHLNGANDSSNDDSSSTSNNGRRGTGRNYNNQADREDHDLFGAMNRLDFGFELGAAGAAMLLRSMTREASADEGISAASGGGDSTPVAIEAAAPPAPNSSLRDLGFEVPYTGKSVPLSKFLGSKATLVVNPKIDDPESLTQVRAGVPRSVPRMFLFTVCADFFHKRPYPAPGSCEEVTSYCTLVETRFPRSAVELQYHIYWY